MSSRDISRNVCWDVYPFLYLDKHQSSFTRIYKTDWQLFVSLLSLEYNLRHPYTFLYGYDHQRPYNFAYKYEQRLVLGKGHKSEHKPI